jgi:hypothetical protein
MRHLRTVDSNQACTAMFLFGDQHTCLRSVSGDKDPA